MIRRAFRTAVLVTAVTVASGCTTSTSTDEGTNAPRAASYTGRACPSDVAAAVVGTVECGTLTVPEDRAAGIGTVRLLVATLTPPNLTADDPLVVVGTDLGARPNYSGIATLAQRTGREVVFLEQRGTGYSTPSLACPAVADQHAIGRSTARCYQELTRRGIDVASYDVSAMAADVVDLIEARGLAPADLISFGSASRIALEVLRTDPQDLRALVLDTPDVPGVDPRPLTARSTMRAVTTVLSWCEQDVTCRERYPHPTALLARAEASLLDDPMRVRGPSPDAPPVLVDPALLVRLSRQTLTDGGSAGGWGLPQALPALLAAAADRDRSRLRAALGELLGVQGPMCAGYRAKCMAAHVVDEGVYDTTLCRDVAVATPRVTAGSTGPGFREAFGPRAWWWRVCDHWPVGRSRPNPPLTSDAPVLVLAGGLAPSTPAPQVRAALSGLAALTLVVVPTGSHNVLGQSCVTAFRDRWLDHPDAPPPSPRCLEQRLEW